MLIADAIEFLITQNGQITTRTLTAKNAGQAAGTRPKTHTGGAKDREATRYAIAFGVVHRFERNKWFIEQLLP